MSRQKRSLTDSAMVPSDVYSYSAELSQKQASEQITGPAKRFISPRKKDIGFLSHIFMPTGASGARGIQEILIYMLMHRDHILHEIISSTAMLPHAPFRMLFFFWSRFLSPLFFQPTTCFWARLHMLLAGHSLRAHHSTSLL